jgi:hypothetical protein
MVPVDLKTGKGKDEMRGSLHCATHDKAVSSFGRDDVFFVGINSNNTTIATTADHYKMANKRDGQRQELDAIVARWSDFSRGTSKMELLQPNGCG